MNINIENDVSEESDSRASLLRPRTYSTSYKQDIAPLRADTDLQHIPDEGEDEGDCHVEIIVSEMEQDSQLMDNNPVAEKLRIEALREMPQSLAVKRTVKAKLTTTISRKSKRTPISLSKRLKYRFSIFLTRLNLAFRDILSSCELWYSSLKTIEGHFGGGVATYFKFLRWLLLINLFIFIIELVFVVLPHLIQQHSIEQNRTSSIGDLISSVPDQMSNTLAGTQQTKELENSNISYTHFKLGHIVTGEGYFTNSSLYYGFYSYNSQFTYNIPKAYFFICLTAYSVTFIILSVRMARSYRKSFIETAGGLKNVYAHKVFCGWDFSIATENAAKLKSESLARELKELMKEDARAARRHSDWFHDVYVKCVRVIFSFLFLLVLGATGVLVHYLLNQSLLNKLGYHAGNMFKVVLDTKSPDEISPAEVGTGEAMLMSFVITSILIILPMLFSWVVRYEEYRRPRTSLYVTMARTFLLELIVVAVLVVFWLPRDKSHSDKTKNVCWETSLGQEVYRLIMTDFIMALVIAVAEFIRSQLNRRHIWTKLGPPSFDISRNTLNLIHNQTLFWVGFFFSPLLSFVIVTKMVLLFYIKKFSVLHNCVPSSRSWRASQTETLFLVFTFLALLGVLVTYGYIITRVHTSDCGPFRGKTYMYEKILENAFQVHEGIPFWNFLMFLTKPGVVAGLLLSMCAGVYYLRAQSLAQMQMVEILREMLHAEIRDKEFLLEKISQITQGRKSQIRHTKSNSTNTSQGGKSLKQE